MTDPDARKTLGYVIVTVGENGPELGSSRVFETRRRAENFKKSIDPSWKPAIYRVRSESEREAHRWG